METKTLRVAFVKSSSTTLLKAVAEDNMSVSVPVSYRQARKENEIVTLTVALSANGKFYVAQGLSSAKASDGKAKSTAMALFAAADAAEPSEEPTSEPTKKSTKKSK